MNLEQFLIRIQSGAYDVAKQLLGQELSIADRIQLRLVSRATNLVVLDYPILTTLYVSTLSPDLDYLEAISKNDRLLRHVSTLVWDHSVFPLCFFPSRGHVRELSGGKVHDKRRGRSCDKTSHEDMES